MTPEVLEVVTDIPDQGIISSELLIDFESRIATSEYKIKLLKLIPCINSASTIYDLKESLSYLISEWIPVKRYITDDHNRRILSFITSIDSWSVNNLATWSIKTIGALLKTSESKFERLISKWLWEWWIVGSLSEKKQSISESLDLFNDEIEIVVWAIVDKVISILSYNVALEKSLVDDLTQLWNRRAFEMFWKQEFDKIKKFPEEFPLSLISFDIDRFKNINDRFLHSGWDLILKEMSKVLKNLVPNYGWEVFRIWWEEFSVILPYTDKKEAKELALVISQELWKIDLREKSTSVPYELTVSTGVLTFDKSSRFTKFWEMVREADYRSYMAKRDWRNTIETTGISWFIDSSPDFQEEIVLNMWDDEKNYDKLLSTVADRLQKFIITLIIKKEKIEWWEHISNLSQIDWTYRQLAYFMKYIFENKWYGDFHWLEKSIDTFIWDNWNKIWLNWRFHEINYFIEKWNIKDIKDTMLMNPIENINQGLLKFISLC